MVRLAEVFPDREIVLGLSRQLGRQPLDGAEDDGLYDRRRLKVTRNIVERISV